MHLTDQGVNELHAEALRRFEQARYDETLHLLGQALSQAESAELWNDWATAQLAAGRAEEAEQGFRCALEVDPQHAQALANLGVLLVGLSRIAEALPLLEGALGGLDVRQRATVEAVLADCRKQASRVSLDRNAVDEFLWEFAGATDNELAYFQTHRARYLATLELLPEAAPDQRLLELGAAFHHLTPALQHCRGYHSITCTDVWSGERCAVRRVRPRREGPWPSEFEFRVDNFDVETAPWPYHDSTFDVVLCCEMLEHLISDPMLVLSEINRVLKAGGLLLLTTPNVASLKSVECVLRGETPYIYGKFEAGGRPTDRHNREYTASEVERLAHAAGFALVQLRTQNSWWKSDRRTLRQLAAAGLPIARRGDNTLLLARKECGVRERHPEEFYQTAGIQSERRDAQSETQVFPPPAQTARVLVVHDVLPMTDRSGSDARLMQILRGLRKCGHAVTYIARNGMESERYLPALEQLGITVYRHDAEKLRWCGSEDPAVWTLAHVLANGGFDLAILTQWFWSGIPAPEQYLDEIRKLSPRTMLAVLTDDCHGLRERRAAELSGLESDWERSFDYEAREFEVYRRADLVLCISEEDRRNLLRAAPDLQIELVPIMADMDWQDAALGGTRAPRGFHARDGILFLGNFENLANREGLKWFLEQVWPAVHGKIPEAKLRIAGHNARAYAAETPGVEWLGHIADLDALFARHRVFVSPIRFGTGIKTKNLAALARGVPLVTTTIGAEGMNLGHEKTAMIADAAEDFAGSIARLYKHEKLWRRLSGAGREHVAKEFSEERLREQLAKVVRRALWFEGHHSRPDPQPFSFMQVEQVHPEVLTHNPANERVSLRMLAYVRMAEELLRAGKPAEAREQLRHVFTFVRGPLPHNPLFARLETALQECYGTLGEERPYERSSAITGQQAKLEAPVRPAVRSAPESNEAPLFSVIIPTYNRRDTLGGCLTALSGQTLPAHKFEVIVVDDGSTDNTAEFCRQLLTPYNLRYIRQANGGAGAARRAGVAQACGEYLLLINDDTIAAQDLLAEHLRVHQQSRDDNMAVLGAFPYPEAARRRALTQFLNTSPFLFPQVAMQSGELYGCSSFITCNLSVRREKVLQAGSFDPAFRVAEDTELGVRLEEAGLRVLYHAEARAWHDHLNFTLADLIQRAKVYGRTDLALFRKHPQLLGDGSSPFGKADREATGRIQDYLAANAREVEQACKSLEQFDHIDFQHLTGREADGESIAKHILTLFSTAVPAVYWFYLLQSFLQALLEEYGGILPGVPTLEHTFTEARCE